MKADKIIFVQNDEDTFSIGDNTNILNLKYSLKNGGQK